MTRGLPFRLLGLHSLRCSYCHRDIVYRRIENVGAVCRWCGHLWFDSASVASLMRSASETFSLALAAMQQAVTSAADTFSSWVATLMGPDA